MDNLLPWAAGLPFVPKVILSLLVVGFAIFVLIVLWTQSSTPENSSGVSPQESKEPPMPATPQSPTQSIVSSPGTIQAGRDVIISSGQPQSSGSPASPEQPRQLSRAECDGLADLLRRGRTTLNKLVAERASDDARAEATRIQNEIRDWLGKRLGAAYAEAFMSAEPSLQVPANYPSQYGGIYQRMRGGLSYLTSIVGRFCG